MGHTAQNSVVIPQVQAPQQGYALSRCDVMTGAMVKTVLNIVEFPQAQFLNKVGVPVVLQRQVYRPRQCRKLSSYTGAVLEQSLRGRRASKTCVIWPRQYRQLFGGSAGAVLGQVVDMMQHWCFGPDSADNCLEVRRCSS